MVWVCSDREPSVDIITLRKYKFMQLHLLMETSQYKWNNFYLDEQVGSLTDFKNNLKNSG